MSNLLIAEVGIIHSVNPDVIAKIVAWTTQLDCFQGSQFFHAAPGAFIAMCFQTPSTFVQPQQNCSGAF